MILRTLLSAFAAASLAAAASPVCPGPANPGSVRCHAHVTTDHTGAPYAGAAPSGYGPAQFRTAYSLLSYSGSSTQVIGIVDAYNDPNIESDLSMYSSQFGLPQCATANGCFRKVDQRGGTAYPRTDSGWSLEIALDVEIAHAICPNCRILLVEADSSGLTNLMAAVNTAARLGATVISNSWGSSEFSGETTYDSNLNHAGIPITVSSGDSGYGVEWPASSRYVTAVGGTTLKLDTSYKRISETAWSGAGSGCSAYEPKPSWQTDKSCARRSVADVSAAADPNTGASVYDTVVYQGRSGWFQVGGTSLASPLIAAVYALAGNGRSLTYASYPYSHTTGLYDVTSGSNGSCGLSYLCTAVAGYDGPTGLGAPKGIGAF